MTDIDPVPTEHGPGSPRASTRLRPAVAADADFVAWGLDEAAGGLFTAMFGGHARKILATVVAEPSHSFSLEHTVIAEVAGTPGGFCQGYPYGTPSGTSALMKAAGIRAVRAGTFALLGRPVFSALDQHSPGEWYLQAIAVKPEARGASVGRALFADAFQRADRAGCDTLALDVDVTNVRAQSLYERLGLHVASTSGKALLLGGAAAHRMIAPVPTP